MINLTKLYDVMDIASTIEYPKNPFNLPCLHSDSLNWNTLYLPNAFAMATFSKIARNGIITKADPNSETIPWKSIKSPEGFWLVSL